CDDPTLTDFETLSLHDALPIWIFEEEASRRFAHTCAERREQYDDQNHSGEHAHGSSNAMPRHSAGTDLHIEQVLLTPLAHIGYRSEEHTSELQSRGHLVCRLLL